MLKNNKISIINPEKLYYTYPNTIGVVCTTTNKKTYIMPAVWQIPLSYEPPMIGVLISPKRNTYEKLIKSGNFSLNYFSYEFADLVSKLGSTTGALIDKVEKYGIKLEKSKIIDSPILAEASVSIECKLIKKEPYGDHVLFSAKIVNITYDGNVIKDNILDITKAKPLLYLGNFTYTTVNSKRKIICKKVQS